MMVRPISDDEWSTEVSKLFDILNERKNSGDWLKKIPLTYNKQSFRKNFRTAGETKYLREVLFCSFKERLARGLVVFQEFAEGSPGFAHNGIVSTILDSHTSYLADTLHGKKTVTKSLEMEFKREVPLFTVLAFEGKLDESNGSVYHVSGQLKDRSSSIVYCECSGVFVPLKIKI